MLILTRRIGESLLIGDAIRVVVLEMRGNQVRLGITAPPEVVVLREEVCKRVQEQNVKSSETQEQDVQEFARLWRQRKGNAL